MPLAVQRKWSCGKCDMASIARAISRNRKIIAANNASKAGIPAYLRPNLLAYWDSRNTPSVSLPLTNGVPNGLPTNTTGWVHFGNYSAETVVSGWLRSTAVDVNPLFGQNSIFSFASGSIIHVRLVARASKSATVGVIFCSGNIGLSNVGSLSVGGVTTGTTISQNVTLTGNAVSLQIQSATLNTAGDYMEVQYVSAINLTAMFGAGNEPTAAEMDAILLASYPSTSWFNGTASCVINPSGQIFLPDSSGQGQHLKYRNMAYTAASGPQSGSPPYVKCDGTDDYMRRKLTTSIASGVAHSFSCWFRASDVTAALRVLRGDTGGSGTHLELSGTAAKITISDGVTYPTATKSVAGNNNKWMLLVAVYDPLTKKGSVYLNNETKATTNAIAGDSVQMDNIIISNNFLFTGYTAGDIADICIFSKTLNDNEVKDLYNYSCARYGKSRI